MQSLDDLVGLRNRPTVIRRLRWIEDRLSWHGIMRRSDVVARFGISPQQASQDIATYQQVNPGFASLDPASKAYLRLPDGHPQFPKDPFRWIAEETAENNESVLPIERLALPNRRADPAVVAALMAAYDSKTPVSVVYQSMSREQNVARVICPHHIVDTGLRYHVRAWDGLRGQFADFVIGRIAVAEPQPDYPWVDAVADRLWQEEVDVVVAAAEGLSGAQRRAVERDYGMANGRTSVAVRKAMVVYVAEALCILDQIQGHPDPNRFRDLRCLNSEELAQFVPGG